MGEFGPSEAGFAAAAAMVHLGFAVGQVPSGVALDRVGPRLTASVLLAIATAGPVLTAAPPEARRRALGEVLTRLGCSGVFVAGLLVTAELLRPDRFGQVAGPMPALSGLGLLASGTPSAWLVGIAAMAPVGLLIGSHVLLCPMAREATPERGTGKALSAVNLASSPGSSCCSRSSRWSHGWRGRRGRSRRAAWRSWRSPGSPADAQPGRRRAASRPSTPRPSSASEAGSGTG